MALRFYLDENLPIVIATQLKLRGIEAVTARDLGHLGWDDADHLRYAAENGYVLCSHDSDYVELATEGFEHTGIIIGQQSKHTVGDWVKGLVLYHTIYDADEMKQRLDYL